MHDATHISLLFPQIIIDVVLNLSFLRKYPQAIYFRVSLRTWIALAWSKARLVLGQQHLHEESRDSFSPLLRANEHITLHLSPGKLHSSLYRSTAINDILLVFDSKPHRTVSALTIPAHVRARLATKTSWRSRQAVKWQDLPGRATLLVRV